MKGKKPIKLEKPISIILVGFLLGFFIAVLSLGLLGPLGIAVFGLFMVFSGIWVMTNYTTKWSKFLALGLILTPIFCIYVFVFNFWLVQLS